MKPEFKRFVYDNERKNISANLRKSATKWFFKIPGKKPS